VDAITKEAELPIRLGIGESATTSRSVKDLAARVAF
jgi:hypothetical protein